MYNSILKKNKNNYAPRTPVIFIPAFRAMLASLKMHYDPTYENDKPIGVTWSKEICEEMLEAYPRSGIHVDAELVNIMTIELMLKCKEISDEIILNFEIGEHTFKLFAKPYEESNG